MKLIVAPSFRTDLTTLEQSLPQSLLLSGERGVGLSTVARHLAATRLEQVIEPLNAKSESDEQRGAINVDTIRRLYETTRGKASTNRVIIIDNAERMTPQAQNSFLKLLEEPPQAMNFILTSHHPQRLLPTIRSRLQNYRLPRISQTQSQQLLAGYQRLSDDEKRQVLFVANGRPALIHKLAEAPNQRQKLVESMGQARQFISTTNRYDRLKIATGPMSNRDLALDFIEACLAILWHQSARSVVPGSLELIKRLLHAHDMIERNASPRLQLMRVVI